MALTGEDLFDRDRVEKFVLSESSLDGFRSPQQKLLFGKMKRFLDKLQFKIARVITEIRQMRKDDFQPETKDQGYYESHLKFAKAELEVSK